MRVKVSVGEGVGEGEHQREKDVSLTSLHYSHNVGLLGQQSDPGVFGEGGGIARRHTHHRAHAARQRPLGDHQPTVVILQLADLR